MLPPYTITKPYTLAQVIPAAWLCLFSPHEVNQLLAGGVGGGGLDLADMRAHAAYSGGFSAASSTVRLFWKARPPLARLLAPSPCK